MLSKSLVHLRKKKSWDILGLWCHANPQASGGHHSDRALRSREDHSIWSLVCWSWIAWWCRPAQKHCRLFPPTAGLQLWVERQRPRSRKVSWATTDEVGFSIQRQRKKERKPPSDKWHVCLCLGPRIFSTTCAEHALFQSRSEFWNSFSVHTTVLKRDIQENYYLLGNFYELDQLPVESDIFF